MNQTVDSITDDLHRLLTRLEKQESGLDAVKCSLLDLQLPFTNQHRPQEDQCSFEELVERVKDHPRGRLVLCVAAENKQLEQLKAENKTLSDSLDKHQAALDLILKKYRLQVSQMMQTKRMENILIPNSSPLAGPTNTSCVPNQSKSNQAALENGLVRAEPISTNAQSDTSQSSTTELGKLLLAARMSTLASMTREVCDHGDAYTAQLEAELQRLRSENSGLREMLMISSSLPDDPSETSDIISSTDNPNLSTPQPDFRCDLSMMPPNQNSCNATCDQRHGSTELPSFMRVLDEFTPEGGTSHSLSDADIDDESEDDIKAINIGGSSS